MFMSGALIGMDKYSMELIQKEHSQLHIECDEAVRGHTMKAIALRDFAIVVRLQKLLQALAFV